MNSFPFVRHHFLRAGMEAIDCPPLTSQLKNSADIRMVMDVRDLLEHETRFDEFIILSGDADFTPLLHRLRAHARRTVIFANEHTAAPYTAIADGEIRESDLITLLLEGQPDEALEEHAEAATERERPAPAQPAVQLEAIRREIMNEVVGWVRMAPQPVPLEALADRAVRTLGHDRTVGTGWGGAGSFSNLLAKGLPGDVRLSDQPPYFVFDASRQLASYTGPAESRRAEAPRETPRDVPATAARSQRFDAYPAERAVPQAAPEPVASQPPPAAPPQPPLRDNASAIHQSITRIHEACQAPPLAPPEYKALFDVMAQEINANGLTGTQTLANIGRRAADVGVEVKRDDIRFILEVVSEADPWFEQGASAALFSGRFRNFVVARCRSSGLHLSAEELDLIDAWFGGAPLPQRAAEPPSAQQAASAARTAPAPGSSSSGDRWWGPEDGRRYGAYPLAESDDDELPLIVRNRVRS